MLIYLNQNRKIKVSLKIKRFVCPPGLYNNKIKLNMQKKIYKSDITLVNKILMKMKINQIYNININNKCKIIRMIVNQYLKI